MCGFLITAGAAAITPAPSLHARGPDQQGHAASCGVDLRSFRLSIVGQATGAQPTRHGTSILVYNGEIYNFRELAAAYELSDLARDSDTHCLHELIEKLTVQAAVPLLVGHFAFACLDERSRTIFFCRDHMGVKPLCFRHEAGQLAVSSDVRTLADSTPNNIDSMAALEAIIFGGHTGEGTLYSTIRTAEPGVLYAYDIRSDRLTRHSVSLPSRVDPGDEELYELIAGSVREQAAISVPGVCLVSSGIDSRIVKALVPAGQPMLFLNAVSEQLAFNPEDRNYDADTVPFEVTTDPSRDSFTDMLLAYGTVPAHNNYFALCVLYAQLSPKSRIHTPEHIKVALTGEGADEYFGGYGRYRQLCAHLEGGEVPWVAALQSLSPRWLYLMNTRLHHSSLAWLRQRGVDVSAIADYHVARTTCDLSAPPALESLSRYDVQTNLRYGLHKQDTAGMNSSVEVRVPMVTQAIHRCAVDGSMAAATATIPKLRLQTVAARLGIHQHTKIGFPVSLETFVPHAYRPSAALQDRFPFARETEMPREIRTSLYMLDTLRRSFAVAA